MSLPRLIVFALLLGAGVAHAGPEEGGGPGRPRENFFLKALRDRLGIDAVRREFVFAQLPGRDLALDIYYPRSPRPAAGYPLIIWLHGGGWILGSKRQDVFVRHFPRYGFAIASIEYRLAPGENFPSQIHDTRWAAWWLFTHARALDLDAGKFVVAGQSAGGHLALLLAYTQGRHFRGWGPSVPRRTRKAVTALYPPTDLARLVTPGARDNPLHPVSLLLGGPVNERPALARSASPIRHVAPGQPPTLLFHGSADPIVPATQSTRLATKLRAAGIPTRLLITDGGHAFTLYPDRVDDILDFLETVPALRGAATRPREQR